MTVPSDGVGRLLHFVDRRLDALRMTKEQIASRGGPEASTLHKVLHRSTQNTPRVRTLLRLDRSLGWAPGSSAVVLLGGYPLSITARPGREEKSSRPVSTEEIVTGLLNELKGQIEQTRAGLAALQTQLGRLDEVHHRLVEEFQVDPELVRAFTPEGDEPAAPGRARPAVGRRKRSRPAT